jgi:hypothetical protein
MSINDRTKRMTSTRRALTVAGMATIAFSLIVSIGPAIAAQGGNGTNVTSGAANGGGNAGTVKIHDAASTLEAGEVGNEPWVCEFWIGFYATDTAEIGTWHVLSWAPTGDGSIVASGSYDTGDDGVDTTSTLAPVEGHYRLEWQAVGDHTVKHKTFWVECVESAVVGDSSPAAAASPGEDESTPSDGDVGPSDEEVATPTDEESTPTDQESAPSDEESTPSDEEAATPTDDESTPTDQESAPSDEESTPSDEEAATPTDDESGEQGGSGQEPEGQVKGGNPDSSPATGSDAVDPAVASGGAAALPDTAIPVNIPVRQSGVLATIGVLLIIAAHAGTRRTRQLPSA